MSLIRDVADGLARLDQTKKSLRNFALTISAVLFVIAVLVFLFSEYPQRSYYFAVIALFILIIGLTSPLLLKPFHTLWMGIALIVGWFISRILLTVIFFIVLTPIGLFMRLLGKDPLDKKIEPEKQSYWIKKQKTSPPRYDKQF